MALRSPTGAAIDGVSVQNDDSVCSGLFFARLRPRGVRRAGVRVLAVDFRARVRPRAIRFFPLWVFRLAAVLFAIFFTDLLSGASPFASWRSVPAFGGRHESACAPLPSSSPSFLLDGPSIARSCIATIIFADGRFAIIN